MEKKKLTQKIIWPIVALYLSQTYLFSYEIFLGVSVLILCVYVIWQKGVLKLPKIPGMLEYIVMLLFISFVGIIRYSLRLVVRDMFYEFSNILLIFLGYHLYKKRKNIEDIITTTVFMVTVTSIITLLSGMVSLLRDPSFWTMRDSFAVGIKSVEVLFPILVIHIFVEKKVVISKVADKLILMLWGVQTLLNLSRVTVVGAAISLSMCVFLLIIYRKISFNKVAKMVGIAIIMVGLFAVVWQMIPESISNHFVNKLENTVSEIAVASEYDSIAEAQTNWRGYEISCAQQQWLEKDFISKVIGSGNGTLIPIFYIPDNWKPIIEVQNGETGITVLHNTYYTLLIKGGLVAVALFIRMFLLNIRKGMKYYKMQNNETGMYLVVLCTIMLVDAYVIRGMVQNDAQLTWSILFGWMNAKISSDLIGRKENNRYEQKI